ncbi:hypothetical protein LE181_30870 [Streptomyces sp. SCA3-4]|uniref:DUF6777 domain-containing protein n=1 Tax=Streptomyces sichuanensis TaxID=2871810 RepID=UPI001CE32144|nr:DUF6777 domain-containing protein [Streptomyces sichuanensis]MCA6096550.1 hypothetical protein [Streptomyces sichuanensis]
MSSEPPSEPRPTGPPPGPLPGRGTPPPGTPSGDHEPTRTDWKAQPSDTSGGPSGAEPPRRGGPAGGGGGGGGPEGAGGAGPGDRPRPPWWRSRAVLVSGAVVVAAALAVYFFRQSGGTGEVFLQSASADGRDPFTKSTARGYGSEASAAPAVPPGTGGGVRTVPGSKPGLYGGTRNYASCDVERQIGFLNQDKARARAFEGAAGIPQGTLAGFLRGLTPVALRADTRVTNHGYRDGSPTSFQSVLQAGTAVLVDERGAPRVRCACGNPLKAPVAVKGSLKAKGDSWPAYRPSELVAVDSAESDLASLVLYDTENRQWFERPSGSNGDEDQPVTPPKDGVTPGPTTTATASSKPATPSPSSAPPSSPGPAVTSPAYGAPAVRPN